MRILVFGCKGQLGRNLLRVLAQSHEVEGWDLPEITVDDETAVLEVVQDFNPRIVINAAAYTDVEGAEDHKEEANLVNMVGAGITALAAAEIGASIVYYSTDFVFDGLKGSPYTEKDPISPLSVYGATKAQGEAAVRDSNSRHFILRTAWLYGPDGNNFVEKMLRLGESRSELRVVEDEVGSPTSTEDLAWATNAIIKTLAYGTHHVVNSGYCTRRAFAEAIFANAGMDVKVHPCLAADFPTKARRPLFGALDNSGFERVCGYRMRPWDEALKAYMENRRNSC